MSRPPDRSDVEREIAFHFQETIDALVASGMTEAAARTEAERRFGDCHRHADVMHSAHWVAAPIVRRWAALRADVIAEVRFAVRGLLRAPAFTATVIATLALASGAHLTVFGIMDALTYRPLAFLRAPREVHRVYWQWTDNGQRITSVSTHYTRFVDLTRGSRTLADVAAFADRSLPVSEGGAVRHRQVAMISASYFRFFDAQPVRGRFFTDDEDRTPRGADVAVLGHAYWRAVFGGRDVVGQPLRVGNINATIVGVAPEGFEGLNDGRPPAVFVPITTYAASTGTSDGQTYFSAYKWGWVNLLVRRAQGVDVSAASAEATRIFNDTWPKFMADNSNVPSADTAKPQVVLSGVRTGAGPAAGPEARTALWLFGLAGAVLAIACANVANLSIARSLARRRDIGVRLALGMSSRRLIVGTCAEALLLAIAGGVTALILAQWTRSALAPLLRTLRIGTPSVFSDQRTLTVTVVVVLFSAVVMGVLPSLSVRRSALLSVQARPGGATVDAGRSRMLLLATQAMLSVTLLIGAGLFVRSLLAVQYASLGYDPGRVLIVTRQIPPGGFDTVLQATLRVQLLEAAAALPDVESAAWMSSVPFVSTSSTDIHVEGQTDATALGPFTFQATTTDYFRTMGTRILRGRGLLPGDTAGAPAVAVVSESMARTLWPGQEALGECIRMRTVDSPCRTIVGIAEDIVQRDLAGGPRLHYYVPIDQYPRTFGNGLFIKLRSQPTNGGENIRVALQGFLPAGFYLVAQPLADVVVDQQASWRIGAATLVVFGALALVVAGVGLFGSVRYDIAQRAREWAVRTALGANRSAIVRLVLRRGLTPVLIGAVPGILIAAALSRWIQPLLYRTSALDLRLFSIAVMLMVGVAVAASVWPALTAARVDPGVTLRGD